MQIGIQLPEVERYVPWTEYRTMAETAEAAGYSSLWLGDHFLYRRKDEDLGPWECWSMLAAIAAVTDRVLLGPLVSPTGFRNPAVLAKMAATVDEIGGGRLILGLGSGWNEREFDAYGVPYDRRVSRFEEEFAIITDLIRTGRSSFSGEFFGQDDNVLVPPARQDLPIMIGSTGPRMLAITAGEMDWWNEWFANFGNRPDKLAKLVDQLDAALIQAGREPADVVRSAALFVELPGYGERTQKKRITPISGDTSEITDRLLEFSDLVDHVQLVVDPITIESIETLAPVVQAIHNA
ncbi:MAG: LLM class flavin-dependent oxidoreductase [Acidimicrobiia bacterium]|nr:LLM class flavin-dependent oxidoreductase [Acidimicrobiia bacterium]